MPSPGLIPNAFASSGDGNSAPASSSGAPDEAVFDPLLFAQMGASDFGAATTAKGGNGGGKKDEDEGEGEEEEEEEGAFPRGARAVPKPTAPPTPSKPDTPKGSGKSGASERAPQAIPLHPPPCDPLQLD